MEENVIKSFYYNRKREIIHFSKLCTDNSLYSFGYLYALENDCYPYLNETDEDKFCINFYKISREFIEQVITEVDKEYSKGIYETFNYWEDKFGKEHREKIIIIFRYCYLEKRFNENFWKILIDHKNNPFEASVIID